MGELIVWCAVMLNGQAVHAEGVVLTKGRMICDRVKCTRGLAVRFKDDIQVISENNCLYAKPQGTIIAREKK